MSKSAEAVTVTLHGKEDLANVTKRKVLRPGGCHATPRWALSSCPRDQEVGRLKGRELGEQKQRLGESD